MTSTSRIEPRIAFKEGGINEFLDGIDEARVGFPVRVLELDHHDERTAHLILADIMDGIKAGRFNTLGLRYRGMNPLRWMEHVAPDVLKPKFLGLFSPAGALLGWFDLMFTPIQILNRTSASFGIVLYKDWQKRGIGSAVLKLVLARKKTLLIKPVVDVFANTKAENVAMIRTFHRVGLFDVGTSQPDDKGRITKTFASAPDALVCRNSVQSPSIISR